MLDTMSQRIYAFALGKLASTDIPQQKLRTKLEEKFITKNKRISSSPSFQEQKEKISEKINSIIETLLSQKYLDDNRYCENFIRWRKAAMPRGKYMIIQELITQGIPSEIAIESCNIYISHHDEAQMCETLLVKKYEILQQKYHSKREYSSHEIQNIIKQKLFSFLAGKHFSYALISEIWEKTHTSLSS